MVLNRLSEAGGRGAGGFLGGIANNPGIIAIVAIIAALVLFRGDIRSAFASIPEAIGNIGNVQLPSIEFPTFEFPQITFPEITFPEFPAFPEFPSFDFLEGIFGQTPPPVPIPPPPGEQEVPGLGTVTTPEGCTVDEQGIIRCPTPPTFDVCQTNPELCAPIPPMDPGLADEPTDAELFAQDFPGDSAIPPQPFMPPVELPGGFVGGGVSFEGGTIFETNDCFLTLNQLSQKYGISASAAANRKAIACTEEPGFQPTDFPESFDFGTNVGEPSLESEAKKAACTSCELFGLNCPVCAGAEMFA